jgi:hypothetical protein
MPDILRTGGSALNSSEPDLGEAPAPKTSPKPDSCRFRECVLNAILPDGAGPAGTTRDKLGSTRRLFAARYARRVQRNVGADPDRHSASIVEICRAIRPQHSFHSASFAVMPRSRFIGLGIFYKMVPFEIRYHANSSPRLWRVSIWWLYVLDHDQKAGCVEQPRHY